MALNNFCAQGRLASDVSVHNIEDEKRAVASFSLAVGRNYKSRDGERPTDFLFCKAFGKTAQFVNKYFEKGQVAVIGNAEVRKDDDYEKDGEKVYGQLYIHLNMGSLMFNEQNRDDDRGQGGAPAQNSAPSRPARNPNISNNPLAAAQMNKKAMI